MRAVIVAASALVVIILIQMRLSSSVVLRGRPVRHEKLRHLQDAQSDCRQQLTSSNGTIASPNYPDDYPNNVVCTWEIVAPVGQTIRLTFTDFHLEISPEDCSADYVDVYDGETYYVFCGRERPPVIESVANEMSVVFVTDELINVGNRFSADYVFLGDGGGGEEGITAYYYVNLSDDKDIYGFFYSPNHPEAYPKDSLVRYDLLKAENGSLFDLPTRVGFLRMDTEFSPDGVDAVDIYQSELMLVSLSGSYQFQDGENTAGLPVFQGIDGNISVVFHSRPEGDAYSGYLFAYASVIPPVSEKESFGIEDQQTIIKKDLSIQDLYRYHRKTSTSSRNRITIDLTTHQITAKNELLQKLARFDSKDNDTVAYGYFMSPNHPWDYGVNGNLEYELLAPEGERIAIYFPRFVTELNYDGLVLSDGLKDIVLSGSDPWDRVYLSNTRQVLATFISDDSVSYTGFLAAFASVRITPLTQD